MTFYSFTPWMLSLLSALAAFGIRGDDDPFYFYLSSNRVYSPGESEISVGFSGNFKRRTTVQLKVYRIADPVKFFQALPNPHSPTIDDTTNPAKITRRDLGDTRRFTLVKSWSKDLVSRNDYWYNEQIAIPVKEKGVYLVSAEARGKAATTVVIVTDLGMIVKQSESEGHAFVVNRKSGQRIPSMPVVFSRGSTHVDGVTGSDGIARVSTAKLATPDGDPEMGWRHYGSQIVVYGGNGEDFAISDSYFYGSGVAEPTQVYLHTDRPVYRPAQTVYYRGIVRKVNPDGGYESPSARTAAIEVSDSRGGLVKRDTVKLSDFSTFNGELQLGDEPPLGTYRIQVTVGDQTHYYSFDVEEYKKPEYEVLVNTDKKQYTKGETIKATVEATYYFGSPVTEATVEYQVFRNRYWRPWWYRSEWAYLYEDDEKSMPYYQGGMEMIHTGRGTLDAAGKLSFSYQTDAKAEEDWVYTLRANVVDNSRREITGAATAKVTRGEFYLTASSDKYVYKPSEQARVNVSILRHDGDAPVATSFDVNVKRTWWEGGRRGGSRDEKVWSGSGSTDGNGNGSVTFTTKDPGYYTYEVSAKDSRGSVISTSSSIYVAAENYPYWYNDGSNNVQIIPDKQLYKPGETMSALVIMPESNIDAWITAEGTAVYKSQVERLSSTSAIVRMPVEARFAPVFFVSASALANDQFYSNIQRIAVAPEGKVLRLEVKTDKAVYKPGEKGVVRVRALDSRGEPAAQTDIAVGIVDEALYAIRPDATTNIQKFFYGNRHNSVTTNSSLYFSFWSGGHAVGRAANAEMAMDGAAAPPPAAPVMASRQALRKDGYMSEDRDALVEPTIRSDFRDLMYWTPSVRTDKDGWATVEVTFPDNLTTWRITARGVTNATAVGQTTAEVIARKDLLVRMETPRFITQGDELLIATTVHNYLSSEKKTQLRFSAEGVELAATEKSVTIAANGEERIDWSIKAPKTGEAKLTIKALTNEESDAMEMTVPILPRGLRQATNALADIDEPSGTRTMTLEIPSTSDPAASTLTLAFSPSAASSILGALDDLVGYPYGCVEQTMSRFLPTVVVADVLGKLDVPFDAKKREELPKMVEKGLLRLYGLQHEDGGWGWWEHDETNPFMTAYVLYGMRVAKEAGYSLDDNRYRNGLSSLHRQIEARKSGGGLGGEDKRLAATTEAYMLYVAALAKDGQQGELVDKRIAALSGREDINNYGRALLALAANARGNTSMATRIASKLEGEVQQTATGAFWKGQAWHYNWQDDQVETTAFVIKALLEIRGETEMVKKGVRWLLAQKEGDSWHNTRQTAMTIYSLVDYIQKTKELTPDYTLAVSVNGRQVYTKRMTKADVFGAEQKITVDRSILRTGANTITIEKAGGGKLYASSLLSYYATGSAIKPTSAGFTVTREYWVLSREKKGGAYVYAKKPFNGTVKSGDEIFVKVKLRPDSRYQYFMLEDPLPAGCEVITDVSGYTVPGENGYEGNGGGYRPYDSWRWGWWYADRDVRDEKVAFFAPTIEARDYEFSYIMRAQIPGSYAVMPSVGALMYYPEVRGNGALASLRILDNPSGR